MLQNRNDTPSFTSFHQEYNYDYNHHTFGSEEDFKSPSIFRKNNHDNFR
jgi:hypothetical protein